MVSSAQGIMLASSALDTGSEAGNSILSAALKQGETPSGVMITMT